MNLRLILFVDTILFQSTIVFWRQHFVMLKISSGLLCALMIGAMSSSSGAVPDSAANEDSETLQTFLKCSNNVMVTSLGLEIHYKQIPAAQIKTSSLREGTASKEIRKYLASFARINVANPLKIGNSTLHPGNYVLGLLEERIGSGRWHFNISEPQTGRAVMRLDPVFDKLGPASCARLMTMEIDRRPGSNKFKLKMRWGDLCVTTKETLEI